MTFSRKSGGVNTTLATFKRRSAGVWVALTTGKRRQSGAWVDILPTTSFAVTLTARSLSATRQSPNTASAVFRLAPGGKLRRSINGGTFEELTPLTEWLDPEDGTGVEGAKYEAMATVASDPSGAAAGTFDTWLQLGVASRDWSAAITTAGAEDSETATSVLTVQIRRVTDQVVVASASITINLTLNGNL